MKPFSLGSLLLNGRWPLNFSFYTVFSLVSLFFSNFKDLVKEILPQGHLCCGGSCGSLVLQAMSGEGVICDCSLIVGRSPLFG